MNVFALISAIGIILALFPEFSHFSRHGYAQLVMAWNTMTRTTVLILHQSQVLLLVMEKPDGQQGSTAEVTTKTNEGKRLLHSKKLEEGDNSTNLS